jgi:hypothetical protein
MRARPHALAPARRERFRRRLDPVRSFCHSVPPDVDKRSEGSSVDELRAPLFELCYPAPYLQLFLKARGLPLSRMGLLLGIQELAGIGGPIILGHLADRRSASFFLFDGLLVSIIAFKPLQAHHCSSRIRGLRCHHGIFLPSSHPTS